MWDHETSVFREEVRSGCMKSARYTLSNLAVFDGAAPISRVYWTWRDFEFFKELYSKSANSEERFSELDRFMKEAAKKWREAGMLEESEFFLVLNAHAQNRSPLVNAIGCR